MLKSSPSDQIVCSCHCQSNSNSFLDSHNIIGMSQPQYSGLKVVPHAEKIAYSAAPEHYQLAGAGTDTHKIAYSAAPKHYQPADAGTDTHKIAYATYASQKYQSRTICGLRKRIFWVLVIVTILVVAAAVGGGVGGALASKKTSNNSNSAIAAQSSPPRSDSASTASTASTTPTRTSAEQSTAITTSTVVGPSSTILRDCPSSNYTLYDASVGDSKMWFRKACEVSFINANGYDNVVNQQVRSLNDCIGLCAAHNMGKRTQIEQGTARICSSVCWRNTFNPINDWAGGMCFGFTTQNSSGTFQLTTPAETRCDSAALINQNY
ncbi:hypothetical protein GQ44DRAFT_713616 [Phaeosphaeriaceae sp. PMI808]|nr:hypothetical protein GQ44DRAFT_713616 [Phaeosphaeriaceae sp. PMI808]